jgi:hypothetical protein
LSKGVTVKTLAAMVTTFLIAPLALAQEPAKPGAPPDASRQDAIRQAVQASMGGTTGNLGPMSDAVIESQLKAAERPETAARMAKFKRNLFDALKAQGFTRDEALAITVATPPPGGLAPR